MNDAYSPGEDTAIAWLAATAEDIAHSDIDRPLVGLTTADSHEASVAYRAAAEQTKTSQDYSSARAYHMLAAVLDMRLTARNPHEPFEAMAIFGDRRSAIPTDFRGKVDVLAAAADKTGHPLIRARLADASWLLERRRRESALQAIASYLELIAGLDAGRFRNRFPDIEPANAFGYDAVTLLRRALQIAKWLKGDEPVLDQIQKLAVDLRRRAAAANASIAVRRLAALDLDFDLSDPATVAQEIEGFIAARGSALNIDSQTELWRLASRAYHAARCGADSYRCRAEAAETLVALAASRGSPFVQAKFLADAISELHGIPDKRARRRQLQHQLVDVQANVVDDMLAFRHETNITDIVEGTVAAFEKLDLGRMLVAFIELAVSPPPEKLIEDERKQIHAHPLAALFSTSHLDRDGKVIHRSEGGLADEATSAAIIDGIVKAESLRRSLVVNAAIEPARQVILSRHLIAEDLLGLLVRHSPFVDPRHEQTFARGLASFFRGDRIAALYVLAPLLEGCLRFVLKSAGHDVTNFDAATQTQQDRMLGPLIADFRGPLEEIFGEPMIYEIEYLFLTRPGPALRHAVAHALLTDGGPYNTDAIYACWLMFKLMMIPLVYDERVFSELLTGMPE